MKCSKCGIDLPEKQIEEHHIIPKSINQFLLDNHKENPTIWLCKKCHDIIHKMLLKQVWKFIPDNKKEEAINHLINYTNWWINLK